MSDALEKVAAVARDLAEAEPAGRAAMFAAAFNAEMIEALAGADPIGVEVAMMQVGCVDGVKSHARRIGAVIRRRAKEMAREQRTKPADTPEIDALLDAAGIDIERPEQDVLALLRMVGSDPPRPAKSFGNVVTILQQDTRYAGRISLNEFKGAIYIDDDLWSDSDSCRAMKWIEDVYGIPAQKSAVDNAVTMIADDAKSHPVRDYITSLQWDGRPRASKLLSRYFGAEPSPLLERISECFLISCVARIMQPGCKVDTTLILTGPQGVKKSSGFSALAVKPEWFCDSAIQIGQKDAYQTIRGTWIYELAELDSMSRRDSATVKAFLTSTRDRYRPSYGRYDVEVPRQCVFVGTTNKSQFLRDNTGSRRFWPVEVGEIDLRAIERDSGHIWAEAVALYHAGADWWLSDEDAGALAEHSDQYQERDVWEAPVAEWCRDRVGDWTGAQILQEALGLDISVAHGAHGIRLRSIMESIGWRSARIRVGMNDPTKARIRITVWRKQK